MTGIAISAPIDTDILVSMTMAVIINMRGDRHLDSTVSHVHVHEGSTFLRATTTFPIPHLEPRQASALQ